MNNDQKKTDAKEISNWLVNRIANYLKVDTKKIAVDRPMTQMGIDSTEAVVLSGDLQQWLERRIPPTVAWEYPTIQALAEHLANKS